VVGPERVPIVRRVSVVARAPDLKINVEVESVRPRRHPVIEVFGPTIQGEGHLIGQPVHFVRFGGCDYRCSWCDSKYAVDPELVRANATHMTDDEIVKALKALPGAPGWVVLSGGNPALQHLDGLVTLLHTEGYRVTIETQGTMRRDWIERVDHVTVSPKPPSAGNVTRITDLKRFLTRPYIMRGVSIKVVVFDDVDYAYARDLFGWVERSFGGYQAGAGDYGMFLSVGNPDPDLAANGSQLAGTLLDRLAWLADRVAADPEMGDVRVLPQLHVLLWGNRRGV
jgi:7-carboxy-7-deazaguanine synthase